MEAFFTKGPTKEELSCTYDEFTGNEPHRRHARHHHQVLIIIITADILHYHYLLLYSTLDNLILKSASGNDEDDAAFIAEAVVPGKNRKQPVDMQYVQRKIRENENNNLALKTKYQSGAASKTAAAAAAVERGRSSNITQDIYSISSLCATLHPPLPPQSDDDDNRDNEEFSACMAGQLMEGINGINGLKTQLTNYRDKMSSRLRNYTCGDDSLETTAPLYTYSMPLNKAGVLHDFKVEVLMHKDHSKIW